MDTRTITEKGKALVKATSANEPAAILSILNELKTGIVATEEILRSTKIGITVNRVKTHSDAAVAKLATEIVKKWREDVQKGGKPNSKPGTPVNGEKKGATPTTTTTATNGKSTSGASTPSVPPDQRSWRKEKIDTNKTEQATRNNCIGLLYDGLAYMSTLPAEPILAAAVKVEAAVMRHFGPDDKDEYKRKVRSLFQNLKIKGNTELRKQIVSGDIDADTFARMSEDELRNEERKREDAILEKENMRDAQVPKVERAISESFTCSNCKQKKVAYTQAQTRSADEPMTTFCECLNCGKHWKFS